MDLVYDSIRTRGYNRLVAWANSIAGIMAPIRRTELNATVSPKSVARCLQESIRFRSNSTCVLLYFTSARYPEIQILTIWFWGAMHLVGILTFNWQASKIERAIEQILSKSS